jgi:integrase
MSRSINFQKKKKVLNGTHFFSLFDSFINDGYSGRRSKKNGKRISENTIYGYMNLRRHLFEFSTIKSFELKIYIDSNLTQNERIIAAKYYKNFYTKFVNFLYDEKDAYDNFIGLLMKGLRCFFNYLEIERRISVGYYHKSFFVPREEIPIVALTAEHLNHIIYNETFNQNVRKKKLEKVKDIFVFGCTVGLRVSDLLQLSRKNLVVKNGKYYVQVKSQKTATNTSIKLPPYCVEILLKYSSESEMLLPDITAQFFNRKLKDLAVLFPDNYEYIKVRERRGKQIVIYKDPVNKIHFKLSDHITSHTMRRTAISVMLGLGMPEHIVRRISGHAPNSREFYRYVQLSQPIIDSESDKVFKKIINMKQ